MRHWLKGNSILVAVDSPSDSSENRRGLTFIGLQDSFGFSVDVPRSSTRQLGSQVFAVNSVNLSPDISFDLSFVPTRKFDTEESLGLNFNFNQSFESVFLNKADTSFNVYLFLSDKQSYDFIAQIKSQQTLNGCECIALGNCYLTSYGLTLGVGSIPKASASLVSSNMEASLISENKVRIPQINFETGEKFGDIFLELDWLGVSKALEEIQLNNQPILSSNNVRFDLSNSNLSVPSAQLSPFSNARIQSLSLSVDIERETSYGFSSNFPYSRKIKYPVVGALNFSTVFSNLEYGSFSGIVNNTGSSEFRFDFLDPQELFLSGKSTGELSSFLATGVSGVTGFYTDSRSLLVDNAKISNWRHNFVSNELSTFDASLSFQCSESGGLLTRFGTSDNINPYWVYSQEARKVFDPSGNLVVHQNYAQVFNESCELDYICDPYGNLILADNFSEESSTCPYGGG